MHRRTLKFKDPFVFFWRQKTLNFSLGKAVQLKDVTSIQYQSSPNQNIGLLILFAKLGKVQIPLTMINCDDSAS